MQRFLREVASRGSGAVQKSWFRSSPEEPLIAHQNHNLLRTSAMKPGLHRTVVVINSRRALIGLGGLHLIVE